MSASNEPWKILVRRIETVDTKARTIVVPMEISDSKVRTIVVPYQTFVGPEVAEERRRLARKS